MEITCCMSPEVREKYEEKRQHIEDYFVEANLEPNTHISAMSPSGDFRLDIDEYETKEVTGWVNTETFVTSHRYVVRKSDGIRYDDLSPDEQKELYQKRHERTETLVETVRWKRPQGEGTLGEG